MPLQLELNNQSYVMDSENSISVLSLRRKSAEAASYAYFVESVPRDATDIVLMPAGTS